MVTYRGLEFDPTPGRLDDVAATAAQLSAAADALTSIESALREADRHSRDWRGAAAEAFRARLAATPRDAETRARSLRDAAAVLDRWARTLADNQRHTEELDATAVRLRARLRAAQDEVQDRQNALDLASTSASAAGATIELAGARSRVAELESSLAEVLERARTLERDHRRAADAAADELAALAAGDPPTPRSTSHTVRALAGVLETASSTSATLAGALARPGARAETVPSGAASAFASALPGLRPSGELIVFGETPLPPGGHS